MMPTISFIIPVYNTEKYLPICLDSVLNQTEQSMEVICINDASKDSSKDILKYYEAVYKNKLKVITLEENKGLSYARNIGLKYAQGKYISYVDSDDIIALNMAEDFCKIASEYDVPIVVSKHLKVSEDIHIQKQCLSSPNNQNSNLVDFTGDNGENIFKQTVSAWSKVYSHDLIEHEYFKDGCIYEDVGYVYRLFLKGKQAMKINDFYYGYRDNPTGIMSKSKQINTDILDILDVCLDAKEYASQYGLSPVEMTCLDDILKRELLKKISWIKSWDILEQEKRFLIEKMLTVSNYYFPNITTLETKRGAKDTNHILKKIDDYKYEAIHTEREADQIERRTLRKIKSLEKHTT